MPTGRIEDYKQLLKDIVTASNSAFHVTGDPTEGPDVVKMPFASVRIGPSISQDLVFGRKTPEVGQYEIVNFSIHVFASNSTTGEKAKLAHEAADDIKTYINQHRTAYKITNEVHDIYDITIRESPPKSFKLSRMILEGKLWVKRKDTP